MQLGLKEKKSKRGNVGCRLRGGDREGNWRVDFRLELFKPHKSTTNYAANMNATPTHSFCLILKNNQLIFPILSFL
jgi:hypothetical protein